MNGNQILKSRPTGSQVTVGREVSSLAASLLATADGVTTRRLRIRDSRKDAACKLHLRQAREKWVLDAEAAQPQAKEEAETAALEKTKLWWPCRLCLGLRFTKPSPSPPPSKGRPLAFPRTRRRRRRNRGSPRGDRLEGRPARSISAKPNPSSAEPTEA